MLSKGVNGSKLVHALKVRVKEANILKFMLKGLIAPIATLILVSSLVTGCQTTAQQSTGSQQSGVIVGHCSAQFKPITTHMTSVRSSSQAVYFITGIHLYALNAGNGRLLWCMYATRANTHLSTLANVATSLFREGPPPSPDGFTGLTVSNGIIYVCSMNGYTYAFQASSGTLRWKQNTGFANTSAPVVVNNTVYVGSGNVYALNVKDGSIRWSYPTPDVVTSSPVIVNGVLYVGSYGDRVYALNAATGVRLWQYNTGGRVYVDPVVANGTVFFGSGDDGWTLYAVRALDGKLLWHGMAVKSSLAVSNGVLYAGSDNSLYGLNSHNGAILWRRQVATPFNTLITNGVIYTASNSGGVDAHEVGNGKLLWHNALNSMHAGETARPVLIRGEVYIETIDLGVSPSKVFLHALNASSGAEDWYATVSWNVSSIGIAA